MAYYNKIGFLILNDGRSKFLVCEKAPEHVTSDYIMPGGKNDELDEMQCLKNEIREELACAIDETSIEFVGEYTDVAAGRSDRDVTIRLFSGRILGVPTPSTEIKQIHWIGKKDLENKRISPIIRNKILPDLIARGVLV